MVPIDKKINAFILAAGFGERLRPITYYIPKPMLPMLGRPVLQYVTERVLTLPVDKIGINLHHKKKVVEDWIRQSSFCEKTIFFPEEAILGTGGALKNAEALLSNKPFLVHNSDIVSDINLEKLLEHHCASENLATLAVHDCPKFNTVVIGRNGFLKGLGTAQDNGRRLAFTGIAVYSPEFLRFIPSGASSVVDAWQKAISSGYRIGTLDVSGCHWNDIGTPSAYASAVLHALRADGEVVYVHPTVDKCIKSDIQGYVVIEKGCILDSGTSLRNCIMLPASRAQGGLRYENCILGPDFTINLDEREISGLAEENGRQLIGTGGSDRRYYRMKDNNNSVVLMQCNSNDPDFARHIEYAIFFLKHCVPVPALINVEFEKMLAIFEDAGDISLYSYLKCLRDESDIEDIYRQVIDAMIQLHIEATEHVAECPLLQKKDI